MATKVEVIMLKLKKFYKSTIASLIPCLCATVALLMSTPTYAAKVDVKVFKEDVEKFDKANIKTILITVPFEGQKVNESDAIADAFALMPLSIAGYYVVPSAVFEEIVQAYYGPNHEIKVHSIPMKVLKEEFGIDAVLTITPFGLDKETSGGKYSVSVYANLIETATGANLWSGEASDEGGLGYGFYLDGQTGGDAVSTLVLLSAELIANIVLNVASLVDSHLLRDDLEFLAEGETFLFAPRLEKYEPLKKNDVDQGKVKSYKQPFLFGPYSQHYKQDYYLKDHPQD